ncbi:MAG: hypothetical protein ACYSU0_02170 [Planctomycetota bacterium]|jgi:hypothetical protein
MMVVLILAALIAIAGPFAMSMFLYERSARHFRDSTRARLAAEGAVAHALSMLRRTEDAVERSGVYDHTWNTPEYDTQLELDVEFRFGGKVKKRLDDAGVKFDDPRGVVWSVRVEDEQAKINVLSAPPRVLGNLVGSANLAKDLLPSDSSMLVDDGGLFLSDDDPRTVDGRVSVGGEIIAYTHVNGDQIEGLSRNLNDLDRIRTRRAGTPVYDAAAEDTSAAAVGMTFKTLFELKRYLRPEDFERMVPHLTVNSYRDTANGWLSGVTLGGFGAATQSFRVQSVAGFSAGARVRFLVDGEPNGVVRRIFSVRQQGTVGVFTLDEPVGFDPDSDVVVQAQPEQVHPVNVNTAERAVLVALFAGVGGGADRVTRTEAEAVADYVYRHVRPDEYDVPNGAPIASQGEFKKMLDDWRKSGRAAIRLSRGKIASIVQNATATICFKAYGNFTIEAAGIVNTPSGASSARHVIRQLVTMPVDSKGRWSISSEHDFDEQMGRLVARKVVSWPFLEPPTDDASLDRYKRKMHPRTGRDTEGYVTLGTGKAVDPGGRGVVEHFDGKVAKFSGATDITHDGARCSGGLRGTGRNLFKTSSRGDWEPITLEMWLKVGGRGAGNRGVFYADSGNPNKDNVSLVYDTGKREFVLRVSDACAPLGDGATGSSMLGGAAKWVSGPAEYRFPGWWLDAGDWYHIAAQVKGSGPGDAYMWVDGVPTTEETIFRPGTRLNGDLGTPQNDAEWLQGTIDVDDTRDFPVKGAIVINGEIIEYNSAVPGRFAGCRRARRFSRAPERGETWRHPSGSLVTPYGYSVPLRDRLFPGRARTVTTLKSRDIGGNCWTFIGAGGSTLGAQDGSIPARDTSRFQKSGFICIRDRGHYEFVYYRSKTRTSFTGCERHQFRHDKFDDPTVSEFSLNGRIPIHQISIATTSLHEYNLPNRGQSRSEGDAQRGGSAKYVCLRPNDLQVSDRVEWVYVNFATSRNGISYILSWTYHGQYTRNGRNESVWAPHTTLAPIRQRLGTVSLIEVPNGTKVLPVVRVAGPQCGDQWSGHSLRGYEYVTPVERDRSEAQPRFITHAHAYEGTHPNTNPRNQYRPWPYSHSFAYRISLDDYVARAYANGRGRILKFPSGEMPRRIPANFVVNMVPDAQPMGKEIDEIRGERGGYRTAMVAFSDFLDPARPVTATARQITIMADMVADGANIPSGGNGRGVSAPERGVIRIDEELIYYGNKIDIQETHIIPWGRDRMRLQPSPLIYKNCPFHVYPPGKGWTGNPVGASCRPGCQRKMRTVMLDDCVRGVLGTQKKTHAPGARVIFLEGLRLTVLKDALLTGGDVFNVLDATGFPEEGYAVMFAPGREPFGGEIVGWTKKSGTSFDGAEDLRGRFGTREQGHRTDDLVLNLPFRYWDRFAVDFKDEASLAYFQGSYAAREAYWYSLELTEKGFDGGAATDLVGLRTVCRFDGEPSWEERPTNRPGGLWEFRGGGHHSFSGSGGGPLIADSIEVRVYWQYESGAWGHEVNDWKRNVRLDNLTVSFGNPLVVRKVDLLDY